MKRLSILGILFLFLFSFALPARAADASLSYALLKELDTSSNEGWRLGQGTAFDAGTNLNSIENFIIVKTADPAAPAMTVYYDMDSWGSVQKDDESLAFSFDLYLKDLTSFQDGDGNFLNGKIGFKGDKVTYYWDFSDVELKRGKNQVFLNFRTAHKIATDDSVLSLFPPDDPGSNATMEDAGEEPTAPKTKKAEGLASYSYLDTSRMFLSMNKKDGDETAVFGIGNVKLVSFIYHEASESALVEEKPVDPSDLLIAAVCGTVIVAAIIAAAVVPVLKKRKRKKK